jgi:hypothetical protein
LVQSIFARTIAREAKNDHISSEKWFTAVAIVIIIICTLYLFYYHCIHRKYSNESIQNDNNDEINQQF